MTATTGRNILIGLLGFLSLGSLFGGGALILSPSGQLLGMPLSLLKNAPFNNFMIPGFILFFVLGLLPILVMFALLYKPNYCWAYRLNLFYNMHWSWTFSIYIAFALIGWIQMETYFLQSVHWSHLLYVAIAISIIITALLPQVSNRYTNEK